MKKILTMFIAFSLAGIVVYYFLAVSQVHAASACDFYRPTGNVDVEEVYSGELELEAVRLSKILSVGGDLRGEYRKFERDTLHKYDDPMQLFFLRAMIHLHCEKLNGQVDEDKLFSLFRELREPWREPSSNVSGEGCSPETNNNSGNVTVTYNGSCNN